MLASLYPTTKVCKLLLISLFVFFLPSTLSAQYLFLEKIEACGNASFCMDCGDKKATCDQFTLDYICGQINRRYSFKDVNTSITFQVLVESSGFSCVLSHSDVTNSSLTSELIRYLNGNIWKAAKENGKPISASVNVMFRIANGVMSARMLRMDLSQLAPPGDPVIYNKTITYTNPSLKNYDFKVWTRYNSPLPDNIGQSAAVDKSDILWYATAKGLTRFDGEGFTPVNEFNSPFTAETPVQDITVDKDNFKWAYAYNRVYKYQDGAGWQIYDFKKFLASGVNHILNSRNGKLLFTTKDGLVVVKKDKVVLLNKKTIPQLPSSNISYAFDDSQQRLWIGTSKGTIMMDGHSIITKFNTANTPLKNMSISGATEDENGNIYFSMVDCNKVEGDNDREGIAVLKANGQWLHYNDKNSGMPANHVNTMLYDKFEHVLWIGTDQSGLVRFNLKDEWENYHNNNSAMPGFTVYQLMQDSKGDIYATTANGLTRIKKK
ncbi:ligand-binding sensor domain-containing protein [Mucilaginibacter pineti]|nr:two-component regulator propeller domain-containing protein [Mucilaginibacter pineti]